MLISDTTPNNAAEGVSLGATISVVFDEEIDVDSVVNNGTFVVITAAQKLASQGPGFEDWQPINEDLLISPNFTGLVDGTIVTEDNLTFTFTPATELTPDTVYRVIIGTGVVSKTVGDIEEAGGNTSTGSFVVKGPYNDNINDSFNVEIIGGGALGTATFKYTRASEGVPSSLLTTDRLVELESGLSLRFLAGAYVVGDEWDFPVIVGVPLDQATEFSFTTGGSTHVQVIEETPSVHLSKRVVSGLLRIDDAPSVDGTLVLLSIDPPDADTNVALSRRRIVLTFNKDLDPDSLTDAVINVIMQSLPMDETAQTSYKIRVTPTVDGPRLILTFSG